MAGIDPGDEVIVPAPYWVSYPDMVAAHGGVPVIVACAESDGFRLTPDALEAAITPAHPLARPQRAGQPDRYALHARTSSPPSPRCSTGTRGCWCCATRSTTRSPSPTGPPPASSPLHPGLRDRILLVNGVSKTYAMTGWRLGWGVGDPGP